MRTFVNLVKNKSFELSTILCFLLPPIGIFLLFTLSFFAIFRLWKVKQFNFSIVSFFFMCLFISTVGATIQMKNLFLLMDSMMILGYWGIYLRIATNSSLDRFRDFKWIMIFGGLYNCVIGWAYQWLHMPPILELLMGTKLFADATYKNYGRLIGSAYNPNFTMHLLLIATALLFAEILKNIRNRQWRSVSWQVPLLLVLSNGVWATGSRAGFFAMICIYFLFFLRLNKVIFLLSTVLTFLLSNPLSQFIPRSDSIDGSFEVRIDIWRKSIELWREHFLFGTTPHGFKNEFSNLFNQEVPHAHDIFIGFFAEFGFIGGIAFIILLCVTIYNLVNLFLYKNKNDQYLEYFLFSLPIIVLTGVLDEPTFSPQIAMLTIILVSYWDQYLKKYVKYYSIKDMVYHIRFKKKNYSKY